MSTSTPKPKETSSQISLIANIQSNGLRGYVLFTENEGITTIRAIIVGGSDKESYNWKVHSFPMISTDSSCSTLAMSAPMMGFDLTTIFGPLEVGLEKAFSANIRAVTGENSLIGKTLFLRSNQSGKISCATILPFGSKKTFEARFHYPIEGTVYFIQSENMTGLVSSLSYSSDALKPSTNKWTLMAGLDADASEESKFKHEMNKCNAFLGRPFFIDNVRYLINYFEMHLIEIILLDESRND